MATGDGKTLGNGSSSPFGDGQGGMSSAGRAAPFDMTVQSNPQKPASYNLNQVPAGGRILFADPNGGTIRSAQIGTTAGSNRAPFKVRGS